MSYSPIEVAIALSLYAYNDSAYNRALKLVQHFDGACLELEEIILILQRRAGSAATELPFPTAVIYVEHALARYGDEARERTRLAVEVLGSLRAKENPT